MNKLIYAGASLAMLAGCAAQEVTGPSAHQRAVDTAMDRSGQAYIEEGYVQNGVIVTPARNWYYGQTEGYANEIQRSIPQRDWLQTAAAEYGGVVTGEMAEARGTSRSVPEQQAIQRLELIGRFKRSSEPLGTPMPVTPSQVIPQVQSGVSGAQMLDVASILDLLSRIDVSSLENVPIPMVPAGLEVWTPHFDIGKNNIKPKDEAQIKKSGATVAGYPSLVMVTGYTDPTGPEVLNDGLSDRRAGAVSKVLTDVGIDSMRLVLIGKPQCCYLNDNKTEKLRAVNRRTETILGGGFTRAATDNPMEIATAIARVFKTIQGDEAAPLRVYGIAEKESDAVALGEQMRRLLTSETVGARNVAVGSGGLGITPAVVIEIIPQARKAI